MLLYSKPVLEIPPQRFTLAIAGMGWIRRNIYEDIRAHCIEQLINRMMVKAFRVISYNPLDGDGDLLETRNE